MALEAHRVLVDASQWTWIKGVGPKYTEEVLVSGIKPILGSETESFGMSVLLILQGLYPAAYTLGAVRQFDPFVGTYLLPMVSATATPESGSDTWRCRYEYMPNPERDAADDGTWVREYGSTMQTAQTNFDYSGNPLTVTYGEGAEEDTYLATVEVMAPQAFMRFTRRVLSTGLAAIATAAQDYVGTINSITWVLAGDAKQWLFSGIGARSHDGGSTFDVTYDFLHVSAIRQATTAAAPEITWDAAITYFDVENNRFPTDPDPTVLIKQIYPTYDFNNFNLPVT